ncbi:MAG TPA: AAA family ATPase [Nannocystis sp.]
MSVIDPPSNPFAVGNAVGGTPYFVGRSDIIHKVVSVLRRPLEPGLVLFGQRRIGKSSILRELEEQLPKLGPWKPVFFDLQRHTRATIEEILEDLASIIATALGLPDPVFVGEDIMGAFCKTWLPEVLKARPDGSRLVLLLDEFDVLTDPKTNSASKRLFEFLRSIFDDNTLRTRVAAIYAMGRTMEDLDISTGPLFRGLRTEPVSTLGRQDFDLLLARGTHTGGIEWGHGVIDAIWRLTAGHPMLTQLLASRAWESAMLSKEPRVDIRQLEELTHSVLRESHNILSWLWEGLTPACRVVASAFAEHGSRSLTAEELEKLLLQSGVRIMMGQLAEAPARLRDWDVLDETQTSPRRYRFKVELLRMWVEKYRPFASVREYIDQVNPEADADYRRALQEWNTGERSPADIDLIIQRLGLVLNEGKGNPNHVGATELLAEVYRSQGSLDRAIQVIARLLPLQTAALRPRYVQLLLTKAENLAGDEEQEASCLQCFQMILEVAPGTSEAITGMRNIWREQGRRAHAAGRLAEARDLYARAEQPTLVSEVDLEIVRIEGEQALSRVRELASGEKFDEAVELLDSQQHALRSVMGPELDSERQEIERARSLLAYYLSGCAAASEGRRPQALASFGHVLAVNPDYKDVQSRVGGLFTPPRTLAHRLALPLGGAFAVALVLLALKDVATALVSATRDCPAEVARAAFPSEVPAGAASTTPYCPATTGEPGVSPTAPATTPVVTIAKPEHIVEKAKPGGVVDAHDVRRSKKRPAPAHKPPPAEAPPPAKLTMDQVAVGFQGVIQMFCRAKVTSSTSMLTLEFSIDVDTGAVRRVRKVESDDKLSDPNCIEANEVAITRAISFAAAQSRVTGYKHHYWVKPKG